MTSELGNRHGLTGRMRARRHLAFFGVLLFSFVLIAAACGGSDDDAPAAGSIPPNDGPASSASGPGISVEDAIASTLDGPLLVNGTLVVLDGDARLCSVLLESFPPRCGGSSLAIAGDFSIDGIDDVQTEGSVSWTDQQIQLLGTVEDGTLTISGTTIA
jgi:hypothetical protein